MLKLTQVITSAWPDGIAYWFYVECVTKRGYVLSKLNEGEINTILLETFQPIITQTSQIGLISKCEMRREPTTSQSETQHVSRASLLRQYSHLRIHLLHSSKICIRSTVLTVLQ